MSFARCEGNADTPQAGLRVPTRYHQPTRHSSASPTTGRRKSSRVRFPARARRGAAGDDDRDRDQDAGQRFAGDEARREQRAGAMCAFLGFVVGADLPNVRVDEVRRAGRRGRSAPSAPAADRCRSPPPSTGTRKFEPRDFRHLVERDDQRADDRADADHVPRQLAAEHALGDRRHQRRLRRRAADADAPASAAPMPYACASRFSTGAMISAHENAPIVSITCCFHGVAPTSSRL